MAGDEAGPAKSLSLPCGMTESKREKKLIKVNSWQCPTRQRSPAVPTTSTFRKCAARSRSRTEEVKRRELEIRK